MADDLYEADFIGWTEQQARLLREAAGMRPNLALDWENLAEEVEALGRSEQRALASQIQLIVIHLLKLEFSPAADPRTKWITTVARARAEVESQLHSDPGLKPRVPQIIADAAPRAARLAGQELKAHGEDPSGVLARQRAGAIYSDAQILGDWWPEHP